MRIETKKKKKIPDALPRKETLGAPLHKVAVPRLGRSHKQHSRVPGLLEGPSAALAEYHDAGPMGMVVTYPYSVTSSHLGIFLSSSRELLYSWLATGVDGGAKAFPWKLSDGPFSRVGGWEKAWT